ncbi:hypothetical protein Ssi03_48690 [Sphaerisporangium siamense]|nr:hypothetical protein Ssi03_48690 [Sphaerisporangium siamense]
MPTRRTVVPGTPAGWRLRALVEGGGPAAVLLGLAASATRPQEPAPGEKPLSARMHECVRDRAYIVERTEIDQVSRLRDDDASPRGLVLVLNS